MTGMMGAERMDAYQEQHPAGRHQQSRWPSTSREAATAEHHQAPTQVCPGPLEYGHNGKLGLAGCKVADADPAGTTQVSAGSML
jgi:hypothetical protein